MQNFVLRSGTHPSSLGMNSRSNRAEQQQEVTVGCDYYGLQLPLTKVLLLRTVLVIQNLQQRIPANVFIKAMAFGTDC